MGVLVLVEHDRGQVDELSLQALAFARGLGEPIALLVGTIAEHREHELTKRPERRVMHGVALRDGGWVTNLHGSTHPPEQRRADLFLAAETALSWAGGGPLVFGGDLNSTRPAMPGLTHVAGNHVDHVMVAGRSAEGTGQVLDAGPLSDHQPLLVTLP